MRILVVEDDAETAAYLVSGLEEDGHAASRAVNGRDGLFLAMTENFDLLFLDIYMPGMDGFEAMRMVREQRPQLPVIVISGRPLTAETESTPDFLTMATKLGAVSGLEKPFRPADLLAAVADCLETAGSGTPSYPTGGVASST